jgi:hypothetical protein
MSTLEVCLGITGQFEGGHGGPRYDLVSGNFDDMGMSVGCLQWNPGTGSIQKLLKLIFQKLGGVPEGCEDIDALSRMGAREATRWVVANWIDQTTPKGAKGPLTDDAQALWAGFLSLEESVAAQKELAQAKLDAAIDEAKHYLPWLGDSINDRIAAFFFDLRVQQGGMSKRQGNGAVLAVPVLNQPYEARPTDAINFACARGKAQTAALWQGILTQDELAGVLLHYAYQRASMARPEYVWDSLSRRGTIACRSGYVHGMQFDLTQILP